MICYAASDKGIVRKQNEDDLLVSCQPVGMMPNLFMVADGMGGHKGGRFASRFTIRTIADLCRHTFRDAPIRLMKDVIATTNRMLYDESKRNPSLSGMGTTLVMATIVEDILYVANVGDSRLYIFDGTSLRQITRDHSFVEEMIQEGKLERDSAMYHEQKNVITRAVGVFPFVAPDFFEVQLNPGDIILMCSDGLTNMVDDEQLTALMAFDEDLETKADHLIDEGIANGGKDNLSVVLIDPGLDEEELW